MSGPPPGPGRRWPAAIPTGLTVAGGLTVLALAPDLIGWVALLGLLVVGTWAGNRLDRPARMAGLARDRARPAAWTVWAVALAAGLWLTLRPDAPWLAVLVGAAAATVTAVERRSSGATGGLIAPAAGYLALFLAGYALIVTAAPLAVLSAMTALFSVLLTLDLVPRTVGARRPIFAVVAGLALAQTTLLLALLPLQPWAEAALAVLLAYCGIGALGQAARNQFSGRVATEYAAVLIVGVLSIGVLGQ